MCARWRRRAHFVTSSRLRRSAAGAHGRCGRGAADIHGVEPLRARGSPRAASGAAVGGKRCRGMDGARDALCWEKDWTLAASKSSVREQNSCAMGAYHGAWPLASPDGPLAALKDARRIRLHASSLSHAHSGASASASTLQHVSKRAEK